MLEKWKVIKSYPDYLISNLGRIKRGTEKLQYKKGRLLSLSQDKNGYLVANLSRNGHVKTLKVHRLVAQTFIPTNNIKLQINHIDGIKDNNCVSNLEWCTASENSIHAVKLGLYKNNFKPQIGEKNGSSKYKSGEIWLIKKLLFYNIRPCIIMKIFKAKKHIIDDVRSGRSWSHIEYN